ncbi:MAG: hypothetical protein BHW07_03410 [Clostridium sp. CAG_433_25_7]|nr:MAG: hypothetical protein BHW07_03410 [Clostridium sp. CAG_433_25_7]
MNDKEELSYSLHLSNDKNKSKKARRSVKNTETGTTSLSNNAIQNHQQLSKVDKDKLNEVYIFLDSLTKNQNSDKK